MRIMTTMQEIERQMAARQKLIDWHIVMQTRDGLVREAADAGMSKAEIAQIVGCRRSTVYEILARHEAGK